MGKIVYLIGKSSTGKDTIFKRLLGGKYPLKNIVAYTTRPIRAGEVDGMEYHFTDEAGYQRLCGEGKVIEQREYDTFHGIWRYFLVDDGQINLEQEDYITIGTLESYCNVKAYFGEDKLLPVLITLDDGERLERALVRERKQSNPRYEEMCRRFLADAEDFSEEKQAKAKIHRMFYNDNLERCLGEIEEYIQEGCSIKVR